MKLYREAAKAEALAIVDVSGSVNEASKVTGVPRSTLRDWIAQPDQHIDAQQRHEGKKTIVKVMEQIRETYAAHILEPEVVKKESGYYSAQVMKVMTEGIQLLTGGATHRIDLATFLTSPAGGGDETDPASGGR